MKGCLAEAVGDDNDTAYCPYIWPRGVRDKLVRLTRVCRKCVTYWYRFFVVYVRAFDNQVLLLVCVL